MKKVFLFMIICLSMSVSNLVMAQTNTTTQSQQQVKFYYYPSSNVYYNPTANNYWYYDDSTSAWVSVTDLPPSITLVKSPHYTVYHNDQDVWKDNAMHLKKYKVKKNGEVKTKPNKD